MQAEEARREEEEEDLELALHQSTAEPPPTQAAKGEPEPGAEPWALPSTPHLLGAASVAETFAAEAPADDRAEAPAEAWAKPDMPPLLMASEEGSARPLPDLQAQPLADPRAQPLAIAAERVVDAEVIVDAERNGDDETDGDETESYDSNGDHIEALPPPETVGGSDHEGGDDQRERRMPPRFLRNYKIQEVIRRRQILLVQVVKEERGTKGAALTTYLSLAGRFGVLMPNSPRGGGISRKITSAVDRRRLKEVMAELDIPRGMGMIVRTAGANRPKPEIKRDCEYLLRLWDDIREHTMKSVAPALIYEEASLIKRAIRDVYSRDIDEILVDGEDGWRAAHDFMRMLMPSHAK
jgi:ribonuclease E